MGLLLLSEVPTTVVSGDGTSEGTSDAAATGGAIATGAATASGAANATAVGSAVTTSTGAATGAASASGTGGAIASGTGSASGTSTATATPDTPVIIPTPSARTMVYEAESRVLTAEEDRVLTYG